MLRLALFYKSTTFEHILSITKKKNAILFSEQIWKWITQLSKTRRLLSTDPFMSQ